MSNKYDLAIFDLDGVIVDTAKYHYLAWKRLGKELGIDFTEEQNEDFKGVSRMACMDIMCKLAGKEDMSQEERERLANLKNEWYVESIGELDESELLSGAKDLLVALKENGIKVALGSASKNALPILERTGIVKYFDTIVDGNHVTKAKPDPEVFVLGAQRLGVEPSKCVVFEDSVAGIEAAHIAGMGCIGIGSAENLPNAKTVVAGLDQVTIDTFK
ncbi:beta-phosphoglucomutase [Cellulosilyticum sp. ST5]|uniref:beta-phosphoglucomutase n=1 Tax=unclassified Cellulosilyticum TaxID=2643091 RepID=UPI000F8E636F|nr:beta-phosphoglucomutase [Cellulosilyticum sp. WCF-2]QEH67577.1 beta-phosphoglucomutase [Cellulosilyticum sp. WCF-2]